MRLDTAMQRAGFADPRGQVVGPMNEAGSCPVPKLGTMPPTPGYAYLMIDRSRQWVKVGIAARFERAKQHSSHGWTEHERTFGADDFLADPRGQVEVTVLSTFERSKETCAKCGARKPSIGRNGSDGLTEIAHLRCFPGVVDVFRASWSQATRTTLDLRGMLDFDPLELRPGGFAPLPKPWLQPPNGDPRDYGKNALNVSCVFGIPSSTVIETLDLAWEHGEVELRRVIGREFGGLIRRRRGLPTTLLADGTPKGSGASGFRSQVEPMLEETALVPKINTILP